MAWFVTVIADNSFSGGIGFSRSIFGGSNVLLSFVLDVAFVTIEFSPLRLMINPTMTGSCMTVSDFGEHGIACCLFIHTKKFLF